MLKHLTLLNWIQWAVLIALQVKILQFSWRKIKTLSMAMIYLLFESLVLFVVVLVGDAKVYSYVYYSLGIIECLFLSLLSIEFGSNCINLMKSKIKKWGPLIVAAPTFCIMIVFFPFQLTKLYEGTLRISQIASILSLSLLFTCFAFEDKEYKFKVVGKSYSILLGLLAICSQLQLNFGLATFVRQSWICSWIGGLSILLWSLTRCMNTGTSKFENRGISAYEPSSQY
jgi:hypothetical protein